MFLIKSGFKRRFEMKYLNSLVFLSLMVLVAGCQKKEQEQPKKASHKSSSKKEEHKVKKSGPTMLETKKSVSVKKDHKNGSDKVTKTTVTEKKESGKMDKKASDHKKAADKKYKKSENMA